MISAEVTVARVLDEHPELVEVLAEVHPHFEQFRSPHLRRVMAPRVTVAQVAHIAGVSADALVEKLRLAVGEEPCGECPGSASPGGPAVERSPESRPPALVGLPDACLVHLDVRDDIRRGQEPFARIMAAVKSLGEGQVLVLRAPFEPIPLYDVLAKRGFAHFTEFRADDGWSVWFHRGAAAPAPAAPATGCPLRTVTIDVRRLEPPQPMVRVLQRLDTLGPAEQLEVLHDRRPMFLYPQLEERGFVHETAEPEPGLVRILISRPVGARAARG